ncbi:MAG: tRNA (adenosine(37)-N6)-threonylcarbamoyltransferase complex transferase subunit TsaD [Desulfohalobiaceae bacterium]
MLCLGIETSCDETALGLLQEGRLLAQSLASQEDMHALFGGVVPEMASREHLRVLPLLLEQVQEQAGVDLQELDLVAVARGPGLLGSILVGLGLAKGLALSQGCRLIGVDHLLAHLLAPGLEQNIQYPVLGLQVSGGHTQIYSLYSPFEYQVLGRTLDDAAGEAFDKTARLLNLPYPGGRHVDALGSLGRPRQDLFPAPYLDNNNLDFSFSGLKTAVANFLQQHPELRQNSLQMHPDPEAMARQNPELTDVCASFNQCVARALQVKVQRALKNRPEIRGLVVAGGVAANSWIRQAMQELAREYGLSLYLPGLELCTDNAAMIAYTGWLYAEQGLEHGLELEAVPRGRQIPWDYACPRMKQYHNP